MFVFPIVIISILLFIYLKRKYFTFHRAIPGKPPQFLFGNILHTGVTRGRYMGDVLREYQEEYGDTFQMLIAFLHLIFVCNPEDVQHIFTHRHIYEQGDFRQSQHRLAFNDALICNIGPKYKRHASIVLPLFRHGKILNNYDLIVDCTNKLLDQWRSIVDSDPKHIHLNVVEECQKLSLAIFGLIGFDYDLQTLDSSNANKSNELAQALGDYTELFLKTARLPYSLAAIYLKLNPRFRQARRIIEKYLNQIMEKEQAKIPERIAGRKRTSLVASLITSLQQDEKMEAMKPEQEKKGLSHEEVIDESLLFLVAGSETVAAVLSWFVYLMSKYPRVQKKLKKELQDHQTTFEQIDTLSYLDAVIEEVLRFRPPFPLVTRTLTVDDQLPVSGIQLQKGDEICLPIYNLSRDKRLWKIDPDLFYPERFQGEDKDHHAYASIPFGAGHRQCIGQDLARFELKIIITRLMQHVTFDDGGEKVNTGGYFQRLASVPKNIGVIITFDH